MSPLRHPSTLPLPSRRPSTSLPPLLHHAFVTVAVAPSIAVAVVPSIAVAVTAVYQQHCHCVAVAPSIAVVAQGYHTMAVVVVPSINNIVVVSSSIGHPSHSLASPVELRLRVGPHALSEKKELREQGCWSPRRRVRM